MEQHVFMWIMSMTNSTMCALAIYTFVRQTLLKRQLQATTASPSVYKHYHYDGPTIEARPPLTSIDATDGGQTDLVSNLDTTNHPIPKPKRAVLKRTDYKQLEDWDA
ncbi:MAG: hypothetical protein [Circular genetic element sp.]|nr:MAG: hypothetical protein [Circular genetic element sp.]